MMRFSKFLKVEADIVFARHALVMDESKTGAEPVIFLHPEFAKKSGVKEGDIVEVEANDRMVKLKVRLSDNAPESGGTIPNGIYASYLATMGGFKRFKASIEVAEGEPSKAEEILEKIKKNQ